MLDIKSVKLRVFATPAPLLFVSHAREAQALQFVRMPASWIGNAIQPPEHQFMICLKRHLEVTASDGKKPICGPGDTVLMEDVLGKGHNSRVKGAGECVSAVTAVK